MFQDYINTSKKSEYKIWDKKLNVNYMGSARTCDHIGCNDRILYDYFNDQRYELKYCQTHMRTPYGNSSDIIPVFTRGTYEYLSNNGNTLCEYLGCKEDSNLVLLYGENWCPTHGRVITYLKIHSSLRISNKRNIFDYKFKEYTYRKSFDINLYNDLKLLENELKVDPNLYTDSNISKVHYSYMNKNKNFSLFSSSNKEYFNKLFGK